jgi:hypothetical protein
MRPRYDTSLQILGQKQLFGVDADTDTPFADELSHAYLPAPQTKTLLRAQAALSLPRALICHECHQAKECGALPLLRATRLLANRSRPVLCSLQLRQLDRPSPHRGSSF